MCYRKNMNIFFFKFYKRLIYSEKKSFGVSEWILWILILKFRVKYNSKKATQEGITIKKYIIYVSFQIMYLFSTKNWVFVTNPRPHDLYLNTFLFWKRVFS